ncbi:MAG: hypothetical protein V3V10_04060 [Planctomycetota bacterium]
MKKLQIILAMLTALAVVAVYYFPADAGSRSARQSWETRNLPEGQKTYANHFATALACEVCHGNADTAENLRDEKKRPVSPYQLWQSSMMANAARDPFWRAVVSAEVANNPEHADAIQQKCMRCHMPMLVTERKLQKQEPAPFATMYKNSTEGGIAIDGVSCTVCHQIAPDKLGTPESFTGGFVIEKGNVIYGPHANPFSMPMIGHSGYFPVQSDHISESSMCGSCHTVFTHAIDNGKATSHQLAEQSPYLEWRNSVFSTEREDKSRAAKSCQDCHMPRVSVDGKPIQTRIARSPNGGDYLTEVRRTFSRHVFVGGNTLLPAIFRDHADELKPLANADAFNATIKLATEQLQNNTARITISKPVLSDGKLEFKVGVHNKAGHKFPSAYPSRRAFLRVRVKDAAGKMIFSSGEFNDKGELLDEHGKVRSSESKGGYEPHLRELTDASQVQIFESVMQDVHGKPTWRLMTGASYIKDNRILPLGWKADGPNADDTRPVGTGTSRFEGGKAVLPVILKNMTGAASIEVELFYQVISWRYANELFKIRTPEILTFQEYLDAADTKPVRVTSATTKVTQK